jgi:hypothetical protein
MAEDCNCGPIVKRKGDLEIKATDDIAAVWARINLLCDDNTAVFLLRSGQKLYLRVIEAKSDE